jgi:hypothetical protein
MVRPFWLKSFEFLQIMAAQLQFTRYRTQLIVIHRAG